MDDEQSKPTAPNFDRWCYDVNFAHQRLHAFHSATDRTDRCVASMLDRDTSYGRYFQPSRGDGDHGSHYSAAFCHSEGSLRYIAPGPMGVRRGRCHVDTPRTKRQYVWEKTGGFCWYCGARLYLRKDADTELKKRLAFTVDHLHPRVHGGRGRANKVPACKYCNSHRSWR